MLAAEQVFKLLYYTVISVVLSKTGKWENGPDNRDFACGRQQKLRRGPREIRMFGCCEHGQRSHCPPSSGGDLPPY